MLIALNHFFTIFTARKRSLGQGNIFSCVSRILFTGGWYPSMYCRWYPSMPCSGGWYPSMPCRFPGPQWGESWGIWPGGSPGPHPRGKLRGLSWGGPHIGRVSRPTPGGSPGPHPGGLQAHTHGGCIPACTEADPPPTATASAVCILLECILVCDCGHLLRYH